MFGYPGGVFFGGIQGGFCDCEFVALLFFVLH